MSSFASALSSTTTNVPLFDAVYRIVGANVISQLLHNVSPALRLFFFFLFGYSTTPQLDAPPPIFLLDAPPPSWYSEKMIDTPNRIYPVGAFVFGYMILLVFGIIFSLWSLHHRRSRSRLFDNNPSKGIVDSVYSLVINAEASPAQFTVDYEQDHDVFVRGIQDSSRTSGFPVSSSFATQGPSDGAVSETLNVTRDSFSETPTLVAQSDEPSGSSTSSLFPQDPDIGAVSETLSGTGDSLSAAAPVVTQSDEPSDFARLKTKTVKKMQDIDDLFGCIRKSKLEHELRRREVDAHLEALFKQPYIAGDEALVWEREDNAWTPRPPTTTWAQAEKILGYRLPSPEELQENIARREEAAKDLPELPEPPLVEDDVDAIYDDVRVYHLHRSRCPRSPLYR